MGIRASHLLGPTLLASSLLALATPASAERTWIEPPKPAPLLVQRPSWPDNHPAICSDRRPLCVHVPSQATAHLLAPALRALESAHARVVDVLGWRPPLPDFGFGPNSGFDVFLTSTPKPWVVLPDPLTDTNSFPKASAFAIVNEDLAGTCGFTYAISASLVRAGIFAIDAAANEELATATAAYVAMLVEPCADMVTVPIDDFQARPDLALSNPAHHGGRGAILFPWYLQSVRGRGAPVDLLHSLWALSVQPTPKDSAILLNEPDFLDTSAILASDLRRSLPDLLLDFAVARAFVGDRDNGIHLPESRFLGSAGAVRFEWSIPYSSLPRRLAPLHPVEPTGASYVWLSLDQLPDDAGLGFRGDWEPPDVFRFALVVVDNNGYPVSRHDPVSPERVQVAEANLEQFGKGKGILVVATNTGPVLRDIAFDPDSHPYTPRSYTVSFFDQ